MARRYERNTIYQPAGVDNTQAEGAASLRDTLLGFSRQASGIAQDRSASRGRAQGIADGSTGNVPKKRSNFTASGRAYNDAAGAAYVARQQVDIEDTYAALEQELPDNSAEFEARSEGFRKGLINAQTDPELRLRLDVLTQARAGEGLRRVRGAQLSKQRDQQRADILAGLDSMVQAAARKVPQDTPAAIEAQNVLQEQIGSTLKTAQDSGLFTASQIRELRSNYAETAQKGIVSGQVANYTSQIIAKYETDILAGDAALRQVQKLDLDDATKVAIQSKVRERLGLLQGERGRQYVLERAALNQDIATNAPSPSAERDAFNLYRRGAITDEQYNTTVGQIERARIEQAKGQADLAIGTRAYQNSTPLDPADTKLRGMMDKVFKNAVAGVERGSAEYQNLAIDIAQRTNIVPSDSISWARTIIAAGDPEKSAAAANFLYRLEQGNPAAYRFVEDPKLKAYVGQVNDAINAGTPSELAVQVAFTNTFELTDVQQKAYADRYSQQFKGSRLPRSQYNSQALKSFLDSDDSYDRSWFRSAPDAPIGLQAEFNSGVEKYYAYTGGDIEQARKLAWRDVRGKWGYSTINGSPELLAYAPERMFPQIDPEKIKADFKATVESVGLDPSKARIMQGPETAATGGYTWLIGIVDEYGAIDTAPGPNNLPIPYDLPGNQFELIFEAEALKKGQIFKERQYSLKQREYNDRFREQALAGDENAALQLLPEPAPGIK